MPNPATAAEWILSLVTTQERAAATVGDCLEGTRSAFAFWWFILRTMFSLCARDAWESRWHLLRLSLYGYVMQILLFAVFVLLPGMLWVSISVALGGKNEGPRLSNWLIPIMGGAIVPFLVGKMVARRSGGREMAAGLACVILPSLIGIVLGITFFLYRHDARWLSFRIPYDAIFILAGALAWRARHPRPT